MNIFKFRHSVCKQCGVHFEPATGFEAQWGHLCSAHRKPVIDEYHRIARVVEWAKRNIDKLEPMMQAEEAEQGKAYGVGMQAMLNPSNNFAFQQQRAAAKSAAQGSFGTGIPV